MLTTLSAVKGYLGIGTTSTDDVLKSLIKSVSAWIEGYLDRTILATDFVETVDGGGREIALTNFPLNSVTSIQYNSGTQHTPVMNTIDPDDYTILYEIGIIEHNDFVFPNGRRNITVAYNSGYDTVPSDLEHVVKTLVAKAYNSRKAQGKKMEIFGSARIEWNMELTEEQKSVLTNYGKVHV